MLPSSDEAKNKKRKNKSPGCPLYFTRTAVVSIRSEGKQQLCRLALGFPSMSRLRRTRGLSGDAGSNVRAGCTMAAKEHAASRARRERKKSNAQAQVAKPSSRKTQGPLNMEVCYIYGVTEIGERKDSRGGGKRKMPQFIRQPPALCRSFLRSPFLVAPSFPALFCLFFLVSSFFLFEPYVL